MQSTLQKKNIRKRIVLDDEEYSQLEGIDLKALCKGHYSPRYEIYRDFLILLYELRTRPIDLMLFRYGHIDNKDLSYIPHKLCNKANENTFTPITPIARKIIERYKGEGNPNGYFIPLPNIAERVWDTTTQEGWNEFYKAHTKELIYIRRFVQGTFKKLNSQKKVTPYAFRRTAITDAIDKGGNLMETAKMFGTSISMFESSYYTTEKCRKTWQH